MYYKKCGGGDFVKNQQSTSAEKFAEVRSFFVLHLSWRRGFAAKREK